MLLLLNPNKSKRVYDFSGGTLPSTVRLTRASVGTYVDSSGDLQEAAIDVPRVTYDPVALNKIGLLIEPERTNSLRNNTMQGASAGSPGTLPTNWVVAKNAGLTQTVVGTGVEDGIEYIDIQFAGTPTATVSNSVGPETNTGVDAGVGEAWTSSMFVTLVDGSTTNLVTGAGNLGIQILGRNEAGSALSGVGFVDFVPEAGELRAHRYNTPSNFLTPADTAYASTNFRFNVTSGEAIDFTVRLGLPQLELGASATSVIKTTGAAVTRVADVLGFTIPDGVTRLKYIFDDSTSQLVSVTPGSYTVPTTLNRPWIKQIVGFK